MNNSNLRDKGLDEIIRRKTGFPRGNDITKRALKRMNLPVFPVHVTYEAALAAPGKGFIYTVRVSNTWFQLADLQFPVLYVKLPVKDASIARKSYNEAIKKHYTPLRWVNRRCTHINYENHITCKLIK